MTLLSATARTLTSRDFREPRDRPSLWDPDERDFNVLLGPKLFIGDMGKGKGVAGAFVLTEFYDHPPAALGSRPKIIVFDIVGRGEISCAFAAMRPENPLYRHLVHQRYELPDGTTETFREPDGTEHVGVNPRGYPVEVRVPLAWAFDRPALEYLQPEIVKPYVLAIDDQMPSDWVEMLGVSEDHRATSLHKKVIEKGTREGWLATATPERLAAEAEALTKKRRKGEGRLYTQKQMQTVGNLYDRLGSERLIMPKHPAWDEERQLPWLDFEAVLKDTGTISVFPLDFSSSRSQAAHLMAVLLNRIIWLKDKNNRNRVPNAVVVYIPDVSIVAAPSFLPHEDKFMRPVKERLLWIASKGTGNQMCLVADMQDFGDVDQAIMGKGTSLGIFKSERDKIRDALKNLSVANRDDILEQDELEKLEKSGFFIWKSSGNPEAEVISGAIPRFEYPRHRLGSLSDFTYVDLWRLMYPKSSAPEKWHDIQPLYKLVESVRRASEDEREQARVDGADGETEAAPKALDFGPLGNQRVGAIVAAAGSRSKMVLGMGDLADVLGDTVAGDDRHLRTAHATKVMRKLERRGFAHPEPESLDGKKMWVIETGRLRKALEKAIPQEYSEAAKKVAEMGDRLKLAFLEGNKDDAMRFFIELAEFAKSHDEDKDVKAVMVGLLGSKLPLTPEMRAMLEGA